ncbi:MAG: hypothetical protein IKQ31_01130 [Clostridia bacterium]|nr:hypothetical protein [Clostridia bacterium]
MQSFVIENKDLKNPNNKYLLDIFTKKLDDEFLEYLKTSETKGLDLFYNLCILQKINPRTFCENHKKTIRWTRRAREQIEKEKSGFYEELNLKVLDLKLVDVTLTKEATKKIVQILRHASRFFFDVQVQFEKSQISYFEIKNISSILQVAPNLKFRGAPVKQLLEAELLSTEIANKIKKLHLSPLEKLIIAHDHTILAIDYADTVNYAEIMNETCSKLKIKCHYLAPSSPLSVSFLIYELCDPKYNIKKGSCYVGDINEDAKNSKKFISYLNILDAPQDIILTPLIDCFTIGDKYLTPTQMPNLKLLLTTPSLNIKTLQSAILNAYATFQLPQRIMSPSTINDAINFSTKIAPNKLRSGSKNPFYAEWEQKKETSTHLKKRITLKTSRI